MKKIKHLKWVLLAIIGSSTYFSNAQSSISSTINSASDDMEEFVTSGLIDPGSSDLEMVTEGAQQIIGLRFTNVALPKNAVVTNAYIMFGADEANNETTNLVIKGEAADNPGTFTSTDKVSTRSTTSETVNWNNIPAWAVNDYTDAQKTPNLKSIVQAIVNRTGWVKNNSMVFVVSGSGKRVADAFDEAAPTTKPAKLVIEYFVPVTLNSRINHKYDDLEEFIAGINQSKAIGSLDTNSSDLELGTEAANNVDPQIVGLRFTNIDIPKGATIVNAYIQFTVDATGKNTSPCNLTIKAEASDNALTFNPFVDGMLASRAKIADSVTMVMPNWPTVGAAGADQRTSDIKSLVQSLVNRQNWKAKNAMAFYITGSGLREAESFEGDAPKAAQLVVEYLGNDAGVVVVKPKYTVGTFPIGRSASWKYDDSGNDLSAQLWNARMYKTDTNWVFGPAKVGYGVTGLGTTLDVNNKRTTYYLRNTFTAPSTVTDFDSLIVFANVNDGAIFYINGVEVKRVNMPNGNVNYSTLASSEVVGNESNKYTRFVIKNTLLAGDTNTISVELHAGSMSSSDISFDVELRGNYPMPAVGSFPIKKGSVWSANDFSGDLGTTWKDLNYNSSNWVHGAGVLGYGDPVSTTLSFGDNSSSKNPTVYFRKTINISSTALLTDSVFLNMRCDDGAVVYINGVEVKRVNMPSGTIQFTTLASAAPANETTYYSYKVSKNAFVNGLNVIAVEVHQDGITSSDLTFDLELKNMPSAPVEASGCVGVNDAHISCFTSVLPSTKNQLLNIPSSHVMQSLVQSGYPYNAGAQGAVSTNSDFTGFIPDNMTSSTKGHLSINHETAVGAVTMLDLHYDAPSKLWVVDSAQGIDFTGVAGTNRNCSGGVTPWGTVITSEETRTAADVNNDGYFDHGWNVEIDPKTNKIVEYGTGKPQKLWAVGRASHENVVVANDSLTLYWGEDAGDGHVYKFVANQKANLSAGTLYALKLQSGLLSNEPTASTGVWIQVPNTTQSDRNNTYSIAKGLGASQFNGVEDVEIHPLTGKIYFTAKGNNRTYRFKDNGSSVTEFETFVGGESYSFVVNGQTITEPWGSGNDNLTFDDRGNLYVLQDGSQDHIWLVLNDHTQDNPKVELFATSPEGSEPTGMTFSPDFKFMFVSMQNPTATNTATQIDAAGKTITMNKSTTLVIARKENLGGVVASVDESYEFKTPFVYPNPSNGEVNINFGLKYSGAVSIEVYGMDGSLVSRTSNSFDAGNQSTSLKLTSGLYIVKITTPNGTTSEKVVIK